MAGMLLWLCCSGAVHAQGEEAAEPPSSGEGVEVADVIVDGRVILKVRGTLAFPAARRAAEIRRQIIAAAHDESIPAGAVTLNEKEDRTLLMAGNRMLLDLFDADAEIEGLSRQILAESKQVRLQEAIANYRRDRSPPVLLTKSLYALAATLIAVGLLFGFWKGFRSLDNLVERRLREHIKTLEAKSARFIRSQQLAKFLRGLVKGLHAVLIALTLYFCLNFVLGLYPWTRGFAIWLFDLILNPLGEMGKGLLATIPDLVFLLILFFVTRYVLGMIHVFFRGIDSGAVKLASFERDWAWPTYRILRLVVVVFALVVAYPHIPGSQSEAFKGISILLGLIVSLGSSSIIGNIIAGYSLTYRRPFKIGDRIRINDTVGEVMEIRVLVTRLRSLKNEEVVIPNTAVLNGEVINYSTLGRQQGLILHTTVGIGYETPWRQVEAMLKQAAGRTSGLLKKPKPFVLQKALGDFAVTYELNAYCTDPKNMAHIYSALYRNILDVFNEYGVGIMTPSYVEDPPEPKLVPQDQWYAAPATPPSASGSG
ncbi:MAG: mechanosensitive ion channel [Pseudomonadota bacterium]|nr:mechanosensitive ion channel [Pseudomonadota bacterium]